MRPMRATPLLFAATLASCGGGGGDPDAAPPADAGPDARPSPAAELGLVAGDPLPPGDWLVLNRWDLPDSVFALSPADLGGAARLVFSANRVWSMGARADGGAIVFSSTDPDQAGDFGLQTGDAVQNTFRYDPATGEVALMAAAGSSWVNVNDECHEPTADGAYVYLCRRYDFVDDPFSFQGWRLGRISTADDSFEFLRADAPTGPWEFNAQAIAGTSQILFELRARPPATGTALWTRDLTDGTEAMVQATAARPYLAPDGHRVLFANTTDLYKLWMFDLAQPSTPAISVSPTANAGDAAWSPDGQTIVYTVYDDQLICDHLERVTWTGTAWSAPVRVRDCAQTGEFITDISWVTVP